MGFIIPITTKTITAVITASISPNRFACVIGAKAETMLKSCVLDGSREETAMSRYIDADAMIARALQDSERDYLKSIAKHTPTIDIVRCKDCKNHEDFPTGISPITCSLSWGGVFENDFCSYGVRKEGDSDETD